MALSECFRKRQKVPEFYELAIHIYSPQVLVFLELLRSVHGAVAIKEQLKNRLIRETEKERTLKHKLNICRDLMFSPG